MKLDSRQTLLLMNVKTASDRYRDARVNGRARLQLALEKELMAAQAEVDHQVRVAFEARVPKRQIGAQGLGTTDPATVLRSLERTEGGSLAAGEIVTPREPIEYELSTDSLTITLSGDVLATVCVDEGWAVGEVVRLGFDSLTLERRTGPAGDFFVSPADANWLPDYRRAHPVAAWYRWNDKRVLADLAELAGVAA